MASENSPETVLRQRIRSSGGSFADKTRYPGGIRDTAPQTPKPPTGIVETSQEMPMHSSADQETMQKTRYSLTFWLVLCANLSCDFLSAFDLVGCMFHIITMMHDD